MTDHVNALIRRQRYWLIAQIVAGVGAIGAFALGCFVTVWALPFALIGFGAAEYAGVRGQRAAGDAARALMSLPPARRR